jgi:DNA-binding response OmpR family regulator
MPVTSILYILIIKSLRTEMYALETRLNQQALLMNDFYIDPIGYQVKMGKTEINLTVKEFELLYLFVSKKGMVVRRSEILQIISTQGQLNKNGAINVEICRLRKKIEVDPHHPKRLISVRGLGYRLK